MTTFATVDIIVFESTAGLRAEKCFSDVTKMSLPGFAAWNTEYGALSVKVRYPKHVKLKSVQQAVYSLLRQAAEGG